MAHHNYPDRNKFRVISTDNSYKNEIIIQLKPNTVKLPAVSTGLNISELIEKLSELPEVVYAAKNKIDSTC